jgi:NitT/TauT family transport system permease protein
VTRGAAVGWVRAGLVVGAFLLLEWLSRTGRIDHRTLIAPSEMAARLTDLLTSGDIVNDMTQTFTSVGAAFLLAVSAGFLAGVAIHAIPRLRRALNPLLASYYSIPFFVFYPLFIAFFGLNKIPLIVIGFVFAAAAMVLATLSGLDRVPSSLIKTAKIMRLGRAKSVRLIILPAAAPYLFAGLKLALAYAFIGVIAGEFILSGGGLGYSIAYAYNNFDNDTMYATMLFVLIVATIMNGILHTWEQRLLRRRGLAK